MLRPDTSAVQASARARPLASGFGSAFGSGFGSGVVTATGAACERSFARLGGGGVLAISVCAWAGPGAGAASAAKATTTEMPAQLRPAGRIALPIPDSGPMKAWSLTTCLPNRRLIQRPDDAIGG